MSKVGVVIVSYNTKELTLRAIDSCLKYRDDLIKQIVVVDNGSKDGSVDQLRKLKKAKVIELIENPGNPGFAKANNQGINVLNTEYILLLNSDAHLTKGSLLKLIKVASTHHDAGALAPQLLNADGSVQDSVFYLPTLKRAILQYWLNGKKYFGGYAPKTKNVIEVEAPVMAAFLITPKGRNAIPLLNEKYFMFFEDLDHCRELIKTGLKIYYVPSAKVYHDKGASGKTVTTDDKQWTRLIPGSKLYHGILVHYLIWFVMWVSQKLGLSK